MTSTDGVMTQHYFVACYKLLHLLYQNDDYVLLGMVQRVRRRSDDISIIAVGCHCVTHENNFVPALVVWRTDYSFSSAVAAVESCHDASALLISSSQN